MREQSGDEVARLTDTVDGFRNLIPRAQTAPPVPLPTQPATTLPALHSEPATAVDIIEPSPPLEIVEMPAVIALDGVDGRSGSGPAVPAPEIRPRPPSSGAGGRGEDMIPPTIPSHTRTKILHRERSVPSSQIGRVMG